MISIYLQPKNRTFAVPNSFTMELGATTTVADNYLTYKWEYSANGTSGWTVINNSTGALAVLTVTLKDTGVYALNYFRCTATEFTNAGAQVDQVVSDVVSAKPFEGRTSSQTTKSRDGAKIRSRAARHHEIDLPAETASIFTAGNFGNPDLYDADDHIDYHNVQSALVDCATSFTMPVDSVITMAEPASDPSGKPQQTVLRFTGQVSSPNSGEPVSIEAFGARVTMPDAAIAQQVRDAILVILQGYEAKGLYVKNVAQYSSDGIQFEHRDNRPHLPHGWTQFGITMTGQVASAAAYGYGQWTQIGTGTIGSKTVYYWQRTA